MKNRPKVKSKPGADVVRLEDLAPREDVHGGAGKLRFGERRDDVPGRDQRAARPGPPARAVSTDQPEILGGAVTLSEWPPRRIMEDDMAKKHRKPSKKAGRKIEDLPVDPTARKAVS